MYGSGNAGHAGLWAGCEWVSSLFGKTIGWFRASPCWNPLCVILNPSRLLVWVSMWSLLEGPPSPLRTVRVRLWTLLLRRLIWASERLAESGWGRAVRWVGIWHLGLGRWESGNNGICLSRMRKVFSKKRKAGLGSFSSHVNVSGIKILHIIIP